MSTTAPTPITILTGFLGSGKTTLILNLLPQLPTSYKLALLKNEFGDLAIDSKLASKSSIAGVRELLNGCICCNLVGQLGDALVALRNGINPSDEDTTTSRTGEAPDRIVIETSGSAFPATLAMEVNRLARETGAFVLDGVVSVIDVENWQGYEDTSVTAKMQAKYTDLIVLNKWEDVSERRLDDVFDRIGDLDIDPPVPCIKSRRGVIDKEAFLGVDGALAQTLDDVANAEHTGHDHDHDHQVEVEVVSATIASVGENSVVDVDALEQLLRTAPKDEVYRIKAILQTSEVPTSSDGEKAREARLVTPERALSQYVLNWAFGRWAYTALGGGSDGVSNVRHPALQMTIVTAKYESAKWIKRIESQQWLRTVDGAETRALNVRRIA